MKIFFLRTALFDSFPSSLEKASGPEHLCHAVTHYLCKLGFLEGADRQRKHNDTFIFSVAYFDIFPRTQVWHGYHFLSISCKH